jgi:hypothetical protein
MASRVYQFTEEQLLSFLGEYAGMVFDATATESLLSLLETLADRGELKLLEEVTP